MARREGLLRELLLRERRFEFLDLVLEFVALAQLLLDRPHLLVEVVLLLRALHLLLHARANLALDLEHLDLALEQAVDFFEAFRGSLDLEHALALLELQRQVRSHRIRESRCALNLSERVQQLRRNLAVELHVLLEARADAAHQRFGFDAAAVAVFERLHLAAEKRSRLHEGANARALFALDDDLHGAVRERDVLEDQPDRADRVDVAFAGFFLGDLALRRQQQMTIAIASFGHRRDRLLTTDVERHHHVRVDDDVAEREERQHLARARFALPALFLVALEDSHGVGPRPTPPRS